MEPIKEEAMPIKPLTNSDPLNPQHYKRTLSDGYSIQAADVIEAFFKDDAHRSQAFKYLARAGTKDFQPYHRDLGKCAWWCIRRIICDHQYRELEGIINLLEAHGLVQRPDDEIPF